MMYVEKKAGVAQTILNTFTPEDVELKETLYCLWIAEQNIYDIDRLFFVFSYIKYLNFIINYDIFIWTHAKVI